MNVIKIQRPAHVPVELKEVWRAAAQKVATAGKLKTNIKTASGSQEAINYAEVNRTYKRILAKYIDLAEQAGNA
jgi:tripartite-type tricarboxylate transporter receptor subunit TctC